MPRLSGEEQQHLVLEEEEDGDEYDYVMMPQMVHSNITSEVVEAFLQDEFLSPSESAGSTDVGADANDHAEEEEEKKYRKPLVLVCGPPRMVVSISALPLVCEKKMTFCCGGRICLHYKQYQLVSRSDSSHSGSSSSSSSSRSSSSRLIVVVVALW